MRESPRLPAARAERPASQTGCCAAVRDYAQVVADNVITADVARDALARLQVDELGLDDIDRRVMSAIVEKFDGGPVGIGTLAASISEDADTIEDVYEPYLLQLGFLDRTPRGRVATRRAYDHLGARLRPPTRRSPVCSETSDPSLIY